MRMPRRAFLQSASHSLAAVGGLGCFCPDVTYCSQNTPGFMVTAVQPGEDVFRYLRRVGQDQGSVAYRALLGAANEFKEGDLAIGVAATDEQSRARARQLLSATRLRDLDRQPVISDELSRLLEQSRAAAGSTSHSAPVIPATLGELKSWILDADPTTVADFGKQLSSLVIGCVVKLMSNEELIAAGRRIFHQLPGSQIGAAGYLGARIQPNSPTDNLDDIRWQVFDGWAYAVGDVVLGTNPVSSDPRSVAAVELALRDVLVTFGLEETLPHCVLAHIDVQAEVERQHPGSTALWFQSIAGTDDANATFDISVEKMLLHARSRSGRYGLYFETGQGADFTNGHGHGFDMVLHESRKYGFARALRQVVGSVIEDRHQEPWVHLNDVAGFIGPEVFRTREQLVRCCLEDIVMGKLHGLTIGLDVCSTLHMDVSLDDLDWCLDRIMPANPAYLMALPTKIDPMLGYLTTGFQDHVRLRQKFGYRVNDAMWRFFQQLEVIDANGQPTSHFGDPAWVYEQYLRRKGDRRDATVIRREAQHKIAEVRGRGVFLAEGFGPNSWDLKPRLRRQIDTIYADEKDSIWAEWDARFTARIPNAFIVQTRSEDRSDYILHPTSGEQLSNSSARRIEGLKQLHGGQYDVQIVVSEGLNALSLMDDGQLEPFLNAFRQNLKRYGFTVAPEHIVVYSGRVRAGYQIGELLYGGLNGHRAIAHMIGERPGTGHHTFSAYLTAPQAEIWSRPGTVDHNLTRVVSGIARTALLPERGARESAEILWQLTRKA